MTTLIAATARRGLIAALIGASLLLAGCGGEAPAPTADQLVGQLTSKVPTARPGQIITPETDPNRLLGRPGGYTSAAMFTDSRIPAEQRDPNPTSLENGGKVEVFATFDEAQRRMDYIQGLARATPLAAEYDYLSGTALIRVSKTLTPAQAEEYRAALG